MAIAVYAVLSTFSFEEAITIAANHNGESDSTASSAGQIYGAWHGESVVLVTWTEKLDIKELMDKLIREFENKSAPIT